MSKDVVMPALGMAQETGTLLRWLKAPGDSVVKGEMLMEVETDKALVEVEATASGILSDVTAKPGDVVPVGQVIARIVTGNEGNKGTEGTEGKRGIRGNEGNKGNEKGRQGNRETGRQGDKRREGIEGNGGIKGNQGNKGTEGTEGTEGIKGTENVQGNGGPQAPRADGLRVSPVAARIAAEHGLDLAEIKSARGVIEKQDVMAYLAQRSALAEVPAQGDKARRIKRTESQSPLSDPSTVLRTSLQSPKVLASPKARRLATERGIELTSLQGSGPDGAVLAADVPEEPVTQTKRVPEFAVAADSEPVAVSNLWRVMVERLSNAWTTIPHFYLARDVNASRLMSWRDVKKGVIAKLTYTDLLVKLVASALQEHPRVNASWQNNQLVQHHAINIGLAVAVEQGLTVPVIHNAQEMSLAQITARRIELIERAHAGKLSVSEITNGTFTISNLGMYGVDAFNAIVNPPQAAILAVSRIAERVVPVNHQPAVQPMLTLTLSCDHRVIDGARGAQFLDTLAQLIEEPLSLLD